MLTFGQYLEKTEDGRVEMNPFVYLHFYEEKIHPYTVLEGNDNRFYDGVSVDEFMNRHKEGFLMEFMNFINDEKLGKKIDKIQEELLEEGKQVCVINLFMLGLFLVEKAKSKYFWLLKPQIKETLAELKEIKKITFTNTDGTKVESNSDALIKTVLEALEAKKDETNYEVAKMVSWDKLSNNVLLQSYFIHDLTEFLNKYFPVKRKNDALISMKEQELIALLMYHLKLSPTIVTESRYRQLRLYYNNIKKVNTDFCNFPFADGEHKLMIMPDFIPYSKWKKGKIDWTKDVILTPDKDATFLFAKDMELDV